MENWLILFLEAETIPGLSKSDRVKVKPVLRGTKRHTADKNLQIWITIISHDLLRVIQQKNSLGFSN